MDNQISIADLEKEIKTTKMVKKFFLIASWMIIIGVVIVPFAVIAPQSALDAEKSSRIEMSIQGIPTGYSTSGYGKYTKTVPTGFRPANNREEIETLAKEKYNSTLSSARFFLGFASMMTLIVLQYLMLGPLNASMRESVSKLESVYAMLLEQQELELEAGNVFDSLLGK